MAKVALLIGVSEYESGLNPLPAAVKDIEAMQRVLQHPDIGGFALSDIKMLRNPDHQEMEEAIQALFDDRHRDDLVLFFFSGHGIKDSFGKFFLSSRKTRKTSKGELLRPTATSASFIQENIKNSRSRRQVIILDCCFSGAFAEGMSAKDDGSVDIRSQLGSEGGAVLTSSSSIEYSFEQQDSELSVYTRYLVEGLETGDADQDRDGFIAIDELHEYAKRRVREVAPQMKPEIYALKEGYHIRLARVPPNDPFLRYRREIERLAYLREITFARRTIIEQVQEWLSVPLQDNVQIPSARRKMLDAFRQRLGLSPEIAAQIESEALEPYRQLYKKIESYEQELIKEMRREKPLKDFTRRRLRELQHELRISDELATEVEQRVSQRIGLSPYLSLQTFRQLIDFRNPSLLKIVLVAVLSIGASVSLVKLFQNGQLRNDPGAILFPESPLTEDPAVPSPQPSNNPIDVKTPSVFSTSPGISVGDDTHFQKGRELYEMGVKSSNNRDHNNAQKYYQAAIEEFTQAVDARQTNSQSEDERLYVYRGHAFYASGNKELAFQDYSKAIEINPDDEVWLAHAYEGRGDTRLDLYNDRRGAIEDYQKALSKYVSQNTLNQDSTKYINNVKRKLGRFKE
ncbi:caspase family protein [Kovacikia minuta CCNUW1]|uniref:caspase, EACC1-associated type n=1 Tax=Kovacikia minuta TaxID=2931930 RepID=UPI001CC8F7EB|nr:caspase family protein [Kovacikia minuta]UBF25282.1 caspase family protein [Kovacikia minuta CCNUW1]